MTLTFPSSAIVPFPRVRNRTFISRHALRMAEFNPAAAERHLERLLRDQSDLMRRRGISEAVIAGEARAVECAIRAALWHLVMRNPGGAA